MVYRHVVPTWRIIPDGELDQRGLDLKTTRDHLGIADAPPTLQSPGHWLGYSNHLILHLIVGDVTLDIPTS